MEKRLLQELDQFEDSDDEILIEGHTIFELPESFPQVLKRFSCIKSLGFVGCKLKSLKNIPIIETIKELNFEDNQLKDDSIETIKQFLGLKYLSLGGNKIEKKETLEQFKDLPNLKILNMDSCPVAKNEEQFVKDVFDLLPNIQQVNGLDKEMNEFSFERSEESEYEEEEESEVSGLLEEDEEAEQEESLSKSQEGEFSEEWIEEEVTEENAEDSQIKEDAPEPVQLIPEQKQPIQTQDENVSSKQNTQKDNFQPQKIQIENIQADTGSKKIE